MDDKKPFRTYKYYEIFFLILTILIVILIFDSKGLLKWANSLNVGEPRQSLMAIIKPVYKFNNSINITVPKDKFDTLYKQVSGIKSDQGFNINLLNDENVAYEVKIDSSKLKELTNTKLKIFSKKNKIRMLLIGDSMMGWGFGVTMENYLNHDSVAIAKRYAKASSGFCRFDFYNWFSQVEDIYKTEKYDVAIIMMGTNDGQGFTVDGELYSYNTAKWKTEYSKRINNFIKLLFKKVKYIYWVSLPPMKSDKMHEIETLINSLVFAEVAKFPNVEWVDSKPVVGDANGKYQHTMFYNNKMNVIRNEDGIHINTPGGEILANVLHNKIVQKFYKTPEKETFIATKKNKRNRN